MAQLIAAVDPGRDKCGVALVDTEGRLVHKAVVPASDVAQHIRSHAVAEEIVAYAVGDGTGYEAVRKRLRRSGVPDERIVPVNEYKSSEFGRQAYWRARPRKGWRRFVPVGLQVPPEPYDDFVAVELARRFLATHSASNERTSP